MSKILITGGGGFVGTNVAWELFNAGHTITIVDREKPRSHMPGNYAVEDYLEFIASYDDEKFDTIVHLAADHEVERSVKEPMKYYTNNVTKMKVMLDIMVARKINNIIFSSSGNTYGRQGQDGALREGLYFDPENPYASTKVTGELLIRDYAKAYGLNYINFRYFNAGGADPDCRYGYVQRPATHVIPILCNKIMKGEKFTIFGSDYPTKDGTCVRDYVHVKDLAVAHLQAVDYLNAGGRSETINAGGGNNGVSVLELVKHATEVVGREPVFEFGPRRAGDPAMLIADITKAKEVLGWSPKYTIQDTIRHAWNWENKFEAGK